MKKAISEAIADINNEINELNERKSALENIETSNMTNAEKWCLLRETPLRSDKEGMLKLAKEFIPGADEYIYDVNEIKVRMGKIIVEIPTWGGNEIKMTYTGQLIKKYPELETPSKEEIQLKGYISLLEQKAHPWTLLRYCFPDSNAFTRVLMMIFLSKKTLISESVAKERYQKLWDERHERSHKRLEAYTTYGNEVCRFDALMYDTLKEFAGQKFKINRNGIYY